MRLPNLPRLIPAFALVMCLVSGMTKGDEEEPSLPPGLEPSDTAEEPALPPGLAEEPLAPEAAEVEPFLSSLPFELSGFWELRGGLRTQRDRHEKDASIGETRLQLQIEKYWEKASVTLTTDFLYDSVLDRHRIHLERGRGFIDLREANLVVRPLDFMDVKIGRQVLTWGTGDLVFINDLFPKDWNSFFIGRDVEYLKAPSDAIKVSVFSGLANLDVVYTPRFDADRFIDGRRISFFNPFAQRITGRNATLKIDQPDDWFEDDEIAWRLYRNVRGYELAVYGYRGYWKSPGGFDPVSLQALFPRLSVFGASVRGTLWKGIGNVEVGYYNSEDDRDGDDPFIRNGEFRFLVGYEQEAAKDFTVGLQYYLEFMLDHDDYLRSLPPGFPRADEDRHVITLRMTKLLLNQNLTLSLFGFFSPSDRDAYLRPHVHYKIDDHWSAEFGGNVFLGEEDHTFFGQFDRNTNIYVGARLSF